MTQWSAILFLTYMRYVLQLGAGKVSTNYVVFDISMNKYFLLQKTILPLGNSQAAIGILMMIDELIFLDWGMVEVR